MNLPVDARPLIIAISGPNGAGKTTFYYTHLWEAALRFVNADTIARELGLEADVAAQAAGTFRKGLVELRESFVFETVFSDPVGDKLEFLKAAAREGYNVIMCFIGVSSPEISEQRVTMRVSQGGHDVSKEKLVSRFPRILANLRRAIRELPRVWVFDNDDIGTPFREVAVFQNGRPIRLKSPLPGWLKRAMAHHGP
jgi:predicted ABC-type ATPase